MKGKLCEVPIRTLQVEFVNRFRAQVIMSIYRRIYIYTSQFICWIGFDSILSLAAVMYKIYRRSNQFYTCGTSENYNMDLWIPLFVQSTSRLVRNSTWETRKSVTNVDTIDLSTSMLPEPTTFTTDPGESNPLTLFALLARSNVAIKA